MKIKENNIIELGLLIPILTLLSFCGIYYYELGYLNYYNIPVDLIEIELTKNSNLIFYFVSSSVFLLFIFQPLFSMIMVFTKPSSKKVKIFSGIFILLLIILCWINVLGRYYNAKIFELFFVLFVGIIFIIFEKKNENLNNEISDDFSIYKYVQFLKIKTVGLIFVYFSISCIIMYRFGHVNAEMKRNYVFCNNNKTILLRKYSEYSIYGISDSLKTHEFTKILIKRSSSDSDTLYLYKVK